MFRPACAYCSAPLAEDQRFCEQCGAPSVTVGAATPKAPPGHQIYEDLWRGFQITHPDNFIATSPAANTVVFSCPDDETTLELVLLPPNQAATPEELASYLLQGRGVRQVSVADSGTNRATLRFEHEHLTGLARVKLDVSGGLLTICAAPRSGNIDVARVGDELIASIEPVPAIPKQPYRCPHEGSFSLLAPRGWTVHSTIAQNVNIRTPMCRVLGDPEGRTAVVIEPEVFLFVDQPRAPPPAADEGFFGTISRWAQQTGEAMSAAMGQTPMPLNGLAPVAEHFFVPRFIEAIPGSECVGFEDHGHPMQAHVTMRLPDGLHRVVYLAAERIDPAPNWAATITCIIQAPKEILDRFMPVLHGVASSFKIDPDWKARDQARFQQALRMQEQHNMQMMQMRHQNNMRALQNQMQGAQAMYEANSAISDMQMETWQNTQAMQDAGHAQTIGGITQNHAAPSPGFAEDDGHRAVINAIRDRADFQTEDGRTYNVDSRFERVWMNEQGMLFGGEWDTQVPLDWTELKKG